eukprot:889650-Pleurochrysis_carterae.AAC.2
MEPGAEWQESEIDILALGNLIRECIESKMLQQERAVGLLQRVCSNECVASAARAWTSLSTSKPCDSSQSITLHKASLNALSRGRTMQGGALA